MSAKHCEPPRGFRKVALFVSAIMLLTPLTAFSDSLTSMQPLELQQHGKLSIQAAPHSKFNVGLDDAGNAMLRLGGISVTLNWDVTEGSQANLFTGTLADSRQDVASLGAIRVKIGIKF